MIVSNIEQGTPEWFQARAGIPTGSCFGKIVTPLGKASDQRDKYMRHIAGEWLMGKPDPDGYRSYWMDRGNQLEPQARAAYSFERQVDVQIAGFVYQDVLRRCGVSPDGLIDRNGGLEIKSPTIHVHVENLLRQKMPNQYIPQVQGCMWVCEREWWDFMSYHPDMEPMIVRISRDDAYIKKLSDAIGSFVIDLHEMKEKLSVYRMM